MNAASEAFLARFIEVWTTQGVVAALDLADRHAEDVGSLANEERQLIASRISELAIHNHEEALAAKPEPVLRRMLAFAESRLGVQHYAVADILGAFGRLLMACDRDAEAEALLLRELTINEANVREHHHRIPYRTYTLDNLLGHYFALKRFDDAATLLEKQLAILGPEASHDYAALTLLNLGKSYLGQHRFSDAEAKLLSAYAYFENKPKTKGLGYNLYGNYSPHMTRTAHAPAGPAAGVARASRMAVRALRPLRRPVSTMEQRAA